MPRQFFFISLRLGPPPKQGKRVDVCFPVKSQVCETFHRIGKSRDGTRRVWVRVEPPHTLTRRPRSYPLPLSIPVNGYNFFPYPSPDRVDGYPRVKIPAFKTRKIGQKIVVKTTHNSCRRVIFHCFAISGVETWSRESDRLDIILGIAKLSV